MVNIKDILDVLPQNIRNIIAKVKELEKLQEIRLKVNKPLIFQFGEREIIEDYNVSYEDINNILKRMSNYSIYSIEDEMKQGYITIKGGHRVGICGNCIIENNIVKTIKNVSSLNIRICREIIGCSDKVMPRILKDNNVLNTIIISPPKCGKTTLIRDITRNISNGINSSGLKGKNICVIDERSEICASSNGIPQLNVGIRTDVMDNCPKSQGIMMAIRSMAPDVIVCDEIGTYEDVKSILSALNCGVNLITTIHGFGIEDLKSRDVFKDVINNRIFQKAIVLSCRKGIGTVEYIYDFFSETTIRGAENA
ncbi:stage III sporulation protein AA [Clostridium pasteurianum]|uniref:Stage III sporulation protein AA n=1 Tax=Clostridium pasteurianum BC1 TaxID=86416 RepID=R4KDI1_CLOPA|nr:stage III sporulation protein AA [Clostridium pasteurianum]AGK97680.1 stage III sporulation protein AA [Clostridium pasteurianum BC1]